MWSAILGILNSGLSILAGWFKAKQSPQEVAAKNATTESQIDQKSTKDVQKAIDSGNVSDLRK